ncbi:hypothetical protein GMMP1_660018 [Candidatus Magnetomoraceae bacterium gMMP-1]
MNDEKKFLAGIIIAFLLTCMTGLANATIIDFDEYEIEGTPVYPPRDPVFDNFIKLNLFQHKKVAENITILCHH